jgi:hypothetical protein
MPVPSAITDLSTTAASNSPAGSESARGTIDDYFRAHAKFIAELRTGAVATTANITAGTISGATVSTNLLNAAGKPILQQTGSILQVVQANTTTQVVVSSATYTDTTLTATITPTSTTSKILVIVDQQYDAYRETDTNYFGIRLLRGSTTIHDPLGDSTGPYDFGMALGNTTLIFFHGRAGLTVLDSPNTTSATTYKTQGRPYTTSDGGVVEFQDAVTVNGKSYITLIEVAA